MAIKGKKDRIDVRLRVELELDSGKKDQVRFTGTYRVYPVSEVKDQLDVISRGEISEPDLIKRDLLAWKGLKGDDDQTVPFTDDELAEMVEVREYLQELVRGWFEANSGRKAADRKNV